MDQTSVFKTLVSRRALLLQHMDETRAELDAWIENHPDGVAGMTELARLEWLLKERRDDLKRLDDLDDALMNHLIILRNGGSAALDGAPPG